MEGEIPDGEDWSKWGKLEILELNNNNFTGILPLKWDYLHNMLYLSVGNNSLGNGLPMPVYHGMQNLKAFDFSMNNFTGPWPEAYFDHISFFNMEYAMTNFNKGTKPPDICIRAAFCFKE